MPLRPLNEVEECKPTVQMSVWVCVCGGGTLSSDVGQGARHLFIYFHIHSHISNSLTRSFSHSCTLPAHIWWAPTECQSCASCREYKHDYDPTPAPKGLTTLRSCRHGNKSFSGSEWVILKACRVCGGGGGGEPLLHQTIYRWAKRVGSTLLVGGDHVQRHRGRRGLGVQRAGVPQRWARRAFGLAPQT